MPDKILSEYGEIVSLFKLCKFYDIDLEVTFDNSKLRAKISRILEYTLELKTNALLPTNLKSVDVSFVFSNEPYHFSSDVVKSFRNDLLILIPSKVEVWVPRKHERLNCYGKVFCNFNIMKDLVIKKDTNVQSLPQNLSNVYRELSKDLPNIPAVMNILKDEVKKVADYGEIVLHKQGQNLPLPVIIVSKYKKPLLLENSQDKSFYMKKYLNDDIISFYYFMLDLKWGMDKVEKEVEKLMEYFSKVRVKSVCYLPVLLFENAVGHIVVASSLDKAGRTLSSRDVYYLKAISDILSEALAKYKLFSLSKGDEYPLAVYDIGLGGIKFEIEQYIAKFVDIGDKVRINIKIENQKLSVKGEVIRIDSSENKLFLVARFVDLDSVDEFVIKDFIDKNLRS